jgi:hypothetical protein
MKKLPRTSSTLKTGESSETKANTSAIDPDGSINEISYLFPNLPHYLLIPKKIENENNLAFIEQIKSLNILRNNSEEIIKPSQISKTFNQELINAANERKYREAEITDKIQSLDKDVTNKSLEVVKGNYLENSVYLNLKKNKLKGVFYNFGLKLLRVISIKQKLKLINLS